MIRVRRIVGTSLAVAALGSSVALAACGGGGGDGDDGPLVINVNQEGTSSAAVPEQVIEVKEGSFAPDSVTIKAGTKVIWKWTATVPCALLIGGTAAPEQSSGTYERLFSTGGSSFSYQCAGKPDMVGRIAIE